MQWLGHIHLQSYSMDTSRVMEGELPAVTWSSIIIIDENQNKQLHKDSIRKKMKICQLKLVQKV